MKVHSLAFNYSMGTRTHRTLHPLCIGDKANPELSGKKHHNIITFLEQSV